MNGSVYDLIVVGSGAAGLAAACTAAARGGKVLVLEASDRVGGTSALSGGMVWIPANPKMAAAGLQDSIAAARRYLAETVPGVAVDARMDAFLAHGEDAINFLEAHTSLRLQPVMRYPDYYPDLPGSTQGGRVLEPVPFDAATLADAFPRLRDPLPEFMLLGGMMVSRQDLPVLRRVGRSPRAFWHGARLVGRYMAQRLHAHRGTTLVLGNALMARLFKSTRDLGVEIRLGAPATALLTEEGAVVGVSVGGKGSSRSDLRAVQGVVLATGGISHHHDLRDAHVPAEAGHLSASFTPGGCRGGAHLALDVGARMTPAASRASGFWVPVSTFRRSDGRTALFPHTVTDRGKPGLIAVDRDGRRFVNEANSYHDFVTAQLADGRKRIPAWLVCDRRFLWKYGLGRIRPFAWSVREDLQSGYLQSSGTLAGLAVKLGVPSESFVHTVQGFNARAGAGEDPAFGRGANSYQRHMGDVEHRPNPCVAPIEAAPFYAVAVVPADLGMAAGLLTDEHARVLNGEGSAIAGLYACGNDMHSVMHGSYPAPGITLGPALVFGYIAATHACARRQPKAGAPRSTTLKARNP